MQVDVEEIVAEVAKQHVMPGVLQSVGKVALWVVTLPVVVVVPIRVLHLVKIHVQLLVEEVVVVIVLMVVIVRVEIHVVECAQPVAQVQWLFSNRKKV